MRALPKSAGSIRLYAAKTTLLAERDALAARVRRMEEALRGCHTLLAMQKFEPDAGAPPMIKDGIWDRVVEAARAALAEPGA